MTLAIEKLGVDSARDDSAWDRFVEASAEGTVFHLTTWRRVVEKVFHHKPHYLAAVEDGDIRGVLPLFEVRGILSGRVLISVPYGVYGGLCATEAPVRQALLQEAGRLAERLRVRYVELRQLHRPEPELQTKSRYVSFARVLDPDPDKNWSAIPGKQRRWIRKGISHSLEARRGWEPLAEFYEIHVSNVGRLGSPPFPRRMFEMVRDEFGKDAELLTVWQDGRMISGVISLFYGDRVLPYYAGSLKEALAIGVNDFMYWDLMRQASLAGYRVFDFSRSREGSGSYEFKRHWGFEPKPLSYQYICAEGHSIPDISPSNPRLKVFIESWKRLPLPMVKWIGPSLTRWLPVD